MSFMRGYEEVSEDVHKEVANIVRGVLSWMQDWDDKKLLGVWKKYRLPPEIVGKYVLTWQVKKGTEKRIIYWIKRIRGEESFDRRVCEEHVSVLKDLVDTCDIVINRYERVIGAYIDSPFVKTLPPIKPESGTEETAFVGSYESDLDRFLAQSKNAEKGKKLTKKGKKKVKPKKTSDVDYSFSGREEDVQEEES